MNKEIYNISNLYIDNKNSVIDSLENLYKDKLIRKCEENKCKLILKYIKNHCILKGEKFVNNIKICDCIIFIEENILIIVLAELKGKNFKTKNIKEKFENSLKQVGNILEVIEYKNTYKIYLLLLSRRINTHEFKILTRKIINFILKGNNIIYILKNMVLNYII